MPTAHTSPQEIRVYTVKAMWLMGLVERRSFDVVRRAAVHSVEASKNGFGANLGIGPHRGFPTPPTTRPGRWLHMRRVLHVKMLCLKE